MNGAAHTACENLSAFGGVETKLHEAWKLSSLQNASKSSLAEKKNSGQIYAYST